MAEFRSEERREQLTFTAFFFLVTLCVTLTSLLARNTFLALLAATPLVLYLGAGTARLIFNAGRWTAAKCPPCPGCGNFSFEPSAAAAKIVCRQCGLDRAMEAPRHQDLSESPL